MTEPEPRKIANLTPRSLRGIAHPLRLRLLSALRRDGPATASQLATKLGESSGSTSYHLRQLAEHGFIEDDPEHGKGRERWWRSAHQGTHFSDSLSRDPDPAVRGAAQLYLHQVASYYSETLTTWIGTSHEWPEEWQDASDMSDAHLYLTPELTAELSGKLHQLIESYRPLAKDKDDPEAALVRVQTQLIPTRPTD
ncbi:helix-turn-helix domain-containing protein [Streptomyces sp. NPDC059009]|uniref:helix-turn-helix domain-containing protein n=1 Tax=Streptomyces sp. NPDC059009 TaxID=3346694 RepID=UPI0036BBF564